MLRSYTQQRERVLDALLGGFGVGWGKKEANIKRESRLTQNIFQDIFLLFFKVNQRRIVAIVLVCVRADIISAVLMRGAPSTDKPPLGAGVNN